MQIIFIRKCFPFIIGCVHSSEVVGKWVEKLSEGYLKVADVSQPGAEVAEATVKRILVGCSF